MCIRPGKHSIRVAEAGTRNSGSCSKCDCSHVVSQYGSAGKGPQQRNCRVQMTPHFFRFSRSQLE